MKLLQLALFLTAALALPPNAIAQAETYSTGPYKSEQDYLRAKYAKTTFVSQEEAIGLVRGVDLRVFDGIEDGCWTNMSGVSARIRVELERSSIPVYDEPLAYSTVFYPRLVLGTNGYRLPNGTCVGSAELFLIYGADSNIGNLHREGNVLNVSGSVRLWGSGFVASSPSTLNDQIMELAQQSIDTLVADVLSKRRSNSVASALDKLPANPPPTEVEFAELLESRKREQENE